MSNQHPFPSSDINNPYNIPPHLLWAGAKTELAIFTFPLDGISDAGRDLLEYAKEHPWHFGIAAVLITGGILFLTVPIIVGFGPIGIIKGSLAARWQSWIGNVVKGSLFAHLQSLSMTGVFRTIGAAMIAMGLLVGVLPILEPGHGDRVVILPVPGPRAGGNRNYHPGLAIPAAAFAAYVGFMGV